MAGIGYTPACGKKRGGVESIALVPAGHITNVEFEDGKCIAITLDEGAEFSGFTLREGEACYTEESASGPGPALIVHTLVFALEMMDGASASVVEALCRNSMDGLVAVVSLADGTRLMAGCSPRFGTAYPLRVGEVSSTSGRKAGDTPQRKLVLVSRDTQPACELAPSVAI